MAGTAPIAAGEWDHSEGMIIAKGDWTDKDGQKHHDFRYPRLIAELPDDWDRDQHKRLIAAAPDMLAVLTEAKAALEYAARGADVITSDKLAVTIGKIDAALARAEGAA
jgi:hypothetical protein